MRLVARLTHLHDAHYPETLREAVILTSSRASTICQMAISLVKPFLASRTAQKLNVVTESSIRNQACLSATVIQALFDNAMKRTNNGPPSGTINKIQTQSNINDSKNEMDEQTISSSHIT